ncbi:MAG: cysteine desulfurase family protein [Bacillota bacterium]|jgi:cysteine desulfurase
MQEIYFDNSATTKVCPEAKQAALMMMESGFGNASSLHGKGVQTARYLAEARKTVAQILQVSAAEIFFTSGGSEGNNTALFGITAAHGKKGRKILFSDVEHPSVTEPIKRLEQLGFTAERVAVDQAGRLDLEDLRLKLSQDTILVSCQQVNNETGTVQPLTEIGALIKKFAPKAFFHIDGVQGFTKLSSDLRKWQADLYTGSGHKIHAPQGVGFLWVRSGVRLLPLVYGGGQEQGQRSGTENMPGIMALAAAAQVADQQRESRTDLMRQVRDTLWQELVSLLPEAVCHSDLAGESAPHILNVGFPGAKSEVLLHYLEEQQIYVSSGSACHSNKNTASPVLLAMGVQRELADCSLRFSFCAENTVTEAYRVAEATAEIVREVRSLTRSG